MMHLHSVACSWHGTLQNAGKITCGLVKLPCCPHCNAPTLATPEKAWQDFIGKSPDMHDFYAWLNGCGKCYKSLHKASLAYFLHTGRVYEIITN